MSLRARHWQFTPDGREFVVTRRDLPDPWANVICTEPLTSRIDQTGAGMTFGRGARGDRLTADDSPRTVYVRDEDSGRHWTINGTHSGRQPGGWECRHGFGYTTLRSRTAGVEGEVTYFLPGEDAVEVWLIRLHNTTARQRRLSVFSYVRWLLAHVPTPPHNDDVRCRRGVIHARCLFWPEDAHRTSLPEFNRAWDRVAFMAASRAPAAFDCLPEGFIGDGTPAAPAAVAAGRCTNSSGRGGENIGVLQHRVRLAAGGRASLVILVGLAEDGAGIGRLIRRYAGVAKAGAAFRRLRERWSEYLTRMTIDLPDGEIAAFANGWNRYGMHQRYTTRYGCRDTAQDMAAYAAFDRGRARRRMSRLYEAQLACGNCLHDVPHFRFRSHVTVNSDVPLWLPWVTARYVKETGDWEWLRGRHGFHDGGSGTVYEHLRRAVDWVLGESGRHGLPQIKCGDWNDALAGAWEKGVSVWLAEFLYANLREMAELARRTRRSADARRFDDEADRIGRTVNEKCWDGGWYRRAFDSTGRPVGSRANREEKIYANPQSWAVLSGLAPPERAVKCMKSVERLMDTPVGIPMMFPAYGRPDPALGEITRFAPYHHHNGGVWNHLNAWVILAECAIGRADRALELYRRIFPPRLAREVERFTAPPYAFGSWTNTPRSRLYGKADLGANTGTTCWQWRVLFEGFCGVRPEHDGLRIDPRLPTSWRWAAVKRPFRGAVYRIRIERGGAAAPGARPAAAGPGSGARELEITLDGRPVASNLIPDDGVAGEHHVLVRVGP
jgi:cellobiose phosphorylase